MLQSHNHKGSGKDRTPYKKTDLAYRYAFCPNCKSQGGIKTVMSHRTPTGRCRSRLCVYCHYCFETNIALPLQCPGCKTHDNYEVLNTRNTREGVSRVYRCRNCQFTVKTFEGFPDPGKADA